MNDGCVMSVMTHPLLRNIFLRAEENIFSTPRKYIFLATPFLNAAFLASQLVLLNTLKMRRIIKNQL